MIEANDDLGAVLATALDARSVTPEAGDILVVTQKVVSKTEGRVRRLADVVVSPPASELAARIGKDPRLVELILGESTRIVRAVRDLLIVEHRLGFILANAGVDQSNVGAEGDAVALLLPEDPDASAARLRTALRTRYGVAIGVLISDSFGRPWRNGVTGTCIGAAGLEVLADRRGAPDLFGRRLQHTDVAVGDGIAAAAALLMGEADERVPAVLVRGLRIGRDVGQTARALLRPAERDLFR